MQDTASPSQELEPPPSPSAVHFETVLRSNVIPLLRIVMLGLTSSAALVPVFRAYTSMVPISPGDRTPSSLESRVSRTSATPTPSGKGSRFRS